MRCPTLTELPPSPLGDRAGALAAYRQALEWQPGEAAIRERIEQASR